MERCPVERRTFSVETYFKDNDFVVMTQWIFRRHFNIHRNDSVPSRNTVLLWVGNCRDTASAAKKTTSRKRTFTFRTPENIELLRQAFVRSPLLAGKC